MRKALKYVIPTLIIGIILGVFVVYPAIFAAVNHLPYAETWYNMFALPSA